MKNVNRHKSGFTLIELLVVISIIAVLMAIMMPALARVREQGKQLVCGTNLKSINTALMLYLQSSDNVFPEPGYAILTLGMQSQQTSLDKKNIWSCPSAEGLRNMATNPNFVTNEGNEGKLYKYEQIFSIYQSEIDKLGIDQDYIDVVSQKYCHYGINAYTGYNSLPAGRKRLSNVRKTSSVVYALDANVYQLWSQVGGSDNSKWRVENRHGKQDKLNVAWMDGHTSIYKFPLPGELGYGVVDDTLRERAELFNLGNGRR